MNAANDAAAVPTKRPPPARFVACALLVMMVGLVLTFVVLPSVVSCGTIAAYVAPRRAPPSSPAAPLAEVGP